ncbi:MAG: helix-turn-helix domain-containing protein [Lachnospiraceae bacterium]|nr:helix-turn-helix domain-containing protein [Lachnospiraceae bacterium]
MLEQYRDVLDVYDAAEALCIGKNRVYVLLGDGSLEGFRIGRVWKIPKKAVEDFINQNSR